MQKKYIVRLTDRERSELVEVVKRLKGTSQKVRRGADAVEGGRRRAELDGPADRRGIFVSHQDCGERPAAAGRTGV